MEGASSSELLNHRRAAAIAASIGLALIFVLLLVGAGDAAKAEPTGAGLHLGPVSYASASSTIDLDTQGRSSTMDPFGESSTSTQSQPPAAKPLPSGVQVDEDHLAPLNEQQLESGGELPTPRIPENLILPDSEVVHSSSSKDFDIAAFVTQQGGFLEVYRQQMAGVWMSGAEIVLRVAQNHSINPRLLLAIVEYQSGWVSDPERPSGDAFDFPIRAGDRAHQGLYLQLTWTANALNRGYYGWRQGTLEPDVPENHPLRVNAGTVALIQLLEGLCTHSECGPGLMATYRQLFGDPWEYGVDIYEEDLNQPSLILPFPGTNEWILTGGPHGAWGSGSPWAAIDFAPKWDPMRRTSDKELVAVADGVVVRVDHGIVVLDLDGDGYEQTGWSILYLHIVAAEGITEGILVRQGQIIGEASSAGGVAYGDHIHIARKYNGEWIPAVGPVPFELGGWRVRLGAEAYDGELYWEGRGCRAAALVVPIWGSFRPAPFQEC